MFRVQPGARPKESRQVSGQLLQAHKTQNVHYGGGSAGKGATAAICYHTTSRLFIRS